MKIIHIVGPICSGKTYLINKAQEKHDIDCFNIKQHHIDSGAIGKDGEFNWEVFRKHRQEKLITSKLTQFLINNRNKGIVFVESSGANQEVNNLLQNLSWAKEYVIPLKPSSKWKEFASKENMDENTVKNSIKFFYSSVEYTLGYSYTQKEAAAKIKEIISKQDTAN